MATLNIPTYANGYIPTINEWNNDIFGAIETRVNDVTWDQVSASLAVDEDNMASDSATQLPTQQSVKAYVDNEIANLDVVVLNNRILDGDKTSDGYPAFIVSGTNNDITIEASAATPLELYANGTTFSITADTVVSALGVATSASAALTGQLTATLGGSAHSYTEGEFGDTELHLVSYVSSLTAASVIDRVQAFQVGTEYFFGKLQVHTAGTRLKVTNVRRGCGNSARSLINENDTVRFLDGGFNHIFIDTSGTTYSTTLYPKFEDSDPVSGTAGEWYFNTTSLRWKRYGTGWEFKDAVWIGSVIVGNGATVEAIVHNDFSLDWAPDISARVRYIDAATVGVVLLRVNIAGETIISPYEIEIDMTTDHWGSSSEAASTLYYLYADKYGTVKFSDLSPREYGEGGKYGYYYPEEAYYRCIGWVYNNSGSDIVPFIQKDNTYYICQNGTGAADVTSTMTDWAISNNITTSYAQYFYSIPPFISIAALIHYNGANQASILCRYRGNAYSIRQGTQVANGQGYNTIFLQNSTSQLLGSGVGAIGTALLSFKQIL